MKLRAGTIKRIHVNQHTIKRNRKLGEQAPPLRVKNRGQNIEARKVCIRGASQVLYRPDRPLGCGARCWIETFAEVEVS